MVLKGKGLTTSLFLSTKMSNKKQRGYFAITDITNKFFRKFLKNFMYWHYLGLKIKQVYNGPTVA